MSAHLVGMVEELTGRKVLGYQSQIIFEPELVVELFFFDRPAEETEIHAGRTRPSRRSQHRRSENRRHLRRHPG